jgi:hypothetical protein
MGTGLLIPEPGLLPFRILPGEASGRGSGDVEGNKMHTPLRGGLILADGEQELDDIHYSKTLVGDNPPHFTDHARFLLYAPVAR